MGAAGKQLGLRVLSTDLSDNQNLVNLQVVALDEPTRQAIQERYGGAVHATAALTPVR